MKFFFAFILIVYLTPIVFGFDIPRYIQTQTIGGAGSDFGREINVDNLGNIYILGQFSSTPVDFDPGVGVDNIASSGSFDVYLTKFNVDGSYAWTKTWGGTGIENAFRVTHDSSNNIYVSLEFQNTVDFDPGAGIDNHVSAGNVDIALIKINSDSTFAWAKTMGSLSEDRPSALAVDSSDNVFLGGKFRGTVDFDPGAGIDNHVSAGDYDNFLTKFNADGSYAWTKTWGGTGRENLERLAFDSNGNLFLAGAFRNTVDFDPDAGFDNQVSNGLDDPFLTKFNADGSYAWTKTWGSANNDFNLNLKISPNNDVYVVGYYELTVDFDPLVATNNLTSAGAQDTFISKFENDGTYDFTYTFGSASPNNDITSGLVFDTDGNWYIGGYFATAIDLDPTPGVNIVTPNATFDLFLTIFDSNDTYLTSKTFGSTAEVAENLYSIEVDGDMLYITGYFSDTVDFNPDSGNDSYTSTGGIDSYLARYSLAEPGVSISPIAGIVTTEAGGSATTSVVLNAKPTDNVVLSFSSSNPSEGSTATSSVVFTPANWNIPQIITISGVDDVVVDGNIGYSLITSGTTSLDPGYNILGTAISDVSITNNDNDVLPVLLVTTSSGGLPYSQGGCLDQNATNFDRYATYQSGTCMYPSNTTTASATPPLVEDIKVTPTGVCSKYITLKERVVFGKKNDIEIVKKIQLYLNNYEKESLVVDGVYKEVDVVAVRRFQEKYKDQILGPWGFESSTGIVAVTTAAKINSIVCAQAVTCPYFSVLTKNGESNSDVPRIKSFLNIVINTSLDTESSVFDQETVKAVKSFQTKYTKFVLRPWGLKQATGWWYQTTMRQANRFMGCSVPNGTLPNGSVVE